MKDMHTHHPYRQLLLMAGLSFAAMFVLMYAMVDRLTNVHANLNQVYMAALMTAAMVLIEIVLMAAMYPDRRSNFVTIAASLVILALAWFGIRRQAAIGDHQFVTSMIPHHGGAILMCRQASLKDPELVALCERIRQSQQEEIDQMRAILQRRGW